MTTAIVSHEHRRGCGYRNPSRSGVGIYLVGPALAAPCGRLPWALDRCPCCSSGIKPTRGWTWVTPELLFKKPATGMASCPVASRLPLACSTCPLGGGIPAGQHGLLWVGGSFYAHPDDFTREAAQMGVSRKLSALPRGFKLGVTWVYLAHRQAISGIDPASGPYFQPGVFSVFKPTGVDLVIEDANAVPGLAETLAERIGEGARIVQVVRADETVQTELFGGVGVA